MMYEEDSKTKKKKRGRSLIFRKYFRLGSTGSEDDKKLASDDNLVYCDVSTSGVDSDSKKSSSSRGGRSRISRIFKAVLFDTAMKKKMRRKNSSKTSSPSVDSSPPAPDDDSFQPTTFIEKHSDTVKTSDPVVSSPPPDPSSPFSLSSKTAASPITSSRSSTINTNPQISTEEKAISREDSTNKKPPLPPNPRQSAKPIPARDTTKLASELSNPKARLCFVIVLSLFLTMILWMIYMAIVAERLEIEPDRDHIVINGDEL